MVKQPLLLVRYWGESFGRERIVQPGQQPRPSNCHPLNWEPTCQSSTLTCFRKFKFEAELIEKKQQNVIRVTFPERNFSIPYLVVWSFVRILLYYFNQRANTRFQNCQFFKIPKLCSQVLHHRMNPNSHINRPMYGYKHCYITIKYCLTLINLKCTTFASVHRVKKKAIISWFNVLYICPS